MKAFIPGRSVVVLEFTKSDLKSREYEPGRRVAGLGFCSGLRSETLKAARFMIAPSADSSAGVVEAVETGLEFVDDLVEVDLALFFRLKVDFIDPKTLLRLELLKLSIAC